MIDLYLEFPKILCFLIGFVVGGVLGIWLCIMESRQQ
jgi:uncharacterized integral membrane protein